MERAATTKKIKFRKIFHGSSSTILGTHMQQSEQHEDGLKQKVTAI